MAQPGQKQSRIGMRRQEVSAASNSLEAALTEALDSNPKESPEQIYRSVVPDSRRRHFAQFFTPPPISMFMARWIAAINPRSVLDPALGPGILLRTLLEMSPEVRTTGLDIDPVALAFANKTICNKHQAELHCTDFLLWKDDRLFDGIISNPPYLRHHELDYGDAIFDDIGRRSRVHLSKLTNIYGLFLLEICRRLRPGGRAAIITPGEWLNANFGQPLKAYLLDNNLLSDLIYFSHAELPFADALTTAAILLVEKPAIIGESRSKVNTYFINDSPAALKSFSTKDNAILNIDGVFKQSLATALLRVTPKWDSLLQRGPTELPPGYIRLRSLATTKRGIATGANHFFHISQDEFDHRYLSEHVAHPCVGSARDVSGVIFRNSEFRNLKASGRKCFLVVLKEPLSKHDHDYISQGEMEGLPVRYLLSKRKPWYLSEDRAPADIWAAVFGRQSFKFVWNLAKIKNLTTFHCIYVKPKLAVGPDFTPALTACLNSSVVQDLAAAQRRVYGNGLRKFEPNDLLDVPVPDLRLVNAPMLSSLRNSLDLMNSSENASSVMAALDELVCSAAATAAEQMSLNRTFVKHVETQHYPPEVLPLWAQRTHRDAPNE